MIKMFLMLVLGGVIGMIITCLAVVSGNADRCAECMRVSRDKTDSNDINSF